ncbi:hypothetical protein ACQ4PT_020474 [Festuca glaucescens]
MKKSAVVAALALIVFVAAAVLPVATVAVATPPSKYTKQEDVTSQLVKGVGSFSVTVYKLHEERTMSYESTSQCWSVPSQGGYEYWSELTAKDGAGAYGRYLSIVWGIPGSESRTWKLLSFTSTN